MEFSDLECDICSNTYSEDHCPRLLPCSHTFCGPCIDGLISAEKKECPLCGKTFMADSAADVAINRSLLNVARQLSSMHLVSRTSSSTPKKSILEFTKDFRENVIGKGIGDLQATEAEIENRIRSYSKMKEGILESNKGIARHIQMMKNIQLSNNKTLGIIEQNIKLMNTQLDAMLQKKVKLCDVKAQLKAKTDFASAGAAMGEAGQILHGVEKTVSEIKQLLQENDRRRGDARKDTLKMKINLENVLEVIKRIIEEEEQQEPEQEQEEGEPEQEQEEGEPEDEERDSVVKIMVTDLRTSRGRLRWDAQREIFVVMTCKGKLRVAPVKIESNNQISFIHLQEGVLPPRCFVIELETLVQWSSPSPSRSPPSSSPPWAFLDLEYGSTPLGSVIVRITKNCLKGLNFLYMCAGGMGPSYTHSHVSGVGNKSWAGESLRMGHYVPHGGGGTSTRAVLSSLEDWEREWKSGTNEWTPWWAGEVRGIISYERASEFWIVTRNNPDWDSGFGPCFGKVVKGLDVLLDAILKYRGPDIKGVRVARCGLIL